MGEIEKQAVIDCSYELHTQASAGLCSESLASTPLGKSHGWSGAQEMGVGGGVGSNLFFKFT